MLLDRDEMSNLYRGPPIDASYQVSVHLAKRFQRRKILKFSQSETMVTCGGHVVNGLGRNEKSLQRTFHRCFLPSLGSFGLAISEEKILKNRPIRNKNRLWLPCLLMDRDEMSTLFYDLPQMLPTKFLIIWQSGFRGEDFQKLTNQKHVC